MPAAPLDRPRLVCPLRRPPKIWGIGLNYRGDLLLTGTPGAAVVEDGDVAGCRIDGFPELRNPVRRRTANAG